MRGAEVDPKGKTQGGGQTKTETQIATRIHLAAELAPGARVDLESGQAHDLRDVLWLEPGAALAAFNARDGEWWARIDALSRGRGRLAVESLRRAPEPEPDIWLVFAPVKRAPIDVLVRKATELGCARLQPMITRHTPVTRIDRATGTAASQGFRAASPVACDAGASPRHALLAENLGKPSL